MSEADEVARGMAGSAPPLVSFTEALQYVRKLMPDEGETLISNIAWSLWIATQGPR